MFFLASLFHFLHISVSSSPYYFFFERKEFFIWFSNNFFWYILYMLNDESKGEKRKRSKWERTSRTIAIEGFEDMFTKKLQSIKNEVAFALWKWCFLIWKTSWLRSPNFVSMKESGAVVYHKQLAKEGFGIENLSEFGFFFPL